MKDQIILDYRWMVRIKKGGMMQPSEDTIKIGVIDQLKRDSRLDISKLNVEVSGGTVKLTGTVPSYRMREIAMMDVLDVPGVTYLTNELKVKYHRSPLRQSRELENL
jgi:osmotically-inducible protein OsmY